MAADFDVVWTRVHNRLRIEIPYDGPLGTSDYFDYLHKLGKAMATNPEIRALADSFLSKAIPRFAMEWKAKRTTP